MADAPALPILELHMHGCVDSASPVCCPQFGRSCDAAPEPRHAQGDIIATPHRGLMMGNRGGCFHLPDRTLGPRRWATRSGSPACSNSRAGIARRDQPHRYTELFFLDEATALAAGHRPCFECRRRDAEHFAALWAENARLGLRQPAPPRWTPRCMPSGLAHRGKRLPTAPSLRGCRTERSYVLQTAVLRMSILLTVGF